MMFNVNMFLLTWVSSTWVSSTWVSSTWVLSTWNSCNSVCYMSLINILEHRRNGWKRSFSVYEFEHVRILECTNLSMYELSISAQRRFFIKLNMFSIKMNMIFAWIIKIDHFLDHSFEKHQENYQEKINVKRRKC